MFRGTVSEEPWDRVFIGIVEWDFRQNATYLWIYNSMQNIPQLHRSGFGKKNGTTKNDTYKYGFIERDLIGNWTYSILRMDAMLFSLHLSLKSLGRESGRDDRQ